MASERAIQKRCPKIRRMKTGRGLLVASLILSSVRVAAQVDPQRAATYFAEAATLCAREDGRLWGIPLCGPMAFADAATHTIATNEPAPEGERPPFLGFANSAAEWGGRRWATYVWQMLPQDDAQARGRLMMHELFHRLQPQLGFVLREGNNEHLDTLEGRYWLQLEWRALAAALGASDMARRDAVRDALAFRTARHRSVAGAAENERLLEMNEGLAQFTGTLIAATDREAAMVDAVTQLARAPEKATFVRTFAYPSGAAYGLLLEAWAPGWTRRVKPEDDLGRLVGVAAGVAPGDDLEAAARRYGGPELRTSEETRDAEQKTRIAALRRTFVEDPVLVVPGSGKNSFMTDGMTPIPGEGIVYPSLRSTAEWGQLQSERALWSVDRTTLRVPAPKSGEGQTLTGAGWTLALAPGWVVRPGPRKGDYEVVREAPSEGPAEARPR